MSMRDDGQQHTDKNTGFGSALVVCMLAIERRGELFEWDGQMRNRNCIDACSDSAENASRFECRTIV